MFFNPPSSPWAHLSDLYFSSKTNLCVFSQQGSPSYSCSYSYIFRWEMLSISALSYGRLCRSDRPKSKECGRHSALAAQWMSSSSLMNMHPLLSLFGVIQCYKILYYRCSHLLSNELFYYNSVFYCVSFIYLSLKYLYSIMKAPLL